VKEFWVYTLMRLGMFVGSFVLVVAVWYVISGDVPVIWAIVIAFVASGVGSYFLLERQRQRLAARVETRAAKMSERFEEQRAKEDVD